MSERVERGRSHLDEGDLRAASIELKNALQQDPRNGDARFLLGRVSVRMGAGAGAEKELRRAAELGEPPARVAYWLARAIQLQGGHERLLEQVEVQPEWPSEGRARLLALRAQALASLGRAADARAALERSRALAGEGLETRLAAVRLAEAARPVAGAREAAAALTDAHPDSIRAWRLRARMALAADDTGAAAEYLGRAIEHAYVAVPERLMRARIRIVRGELEAAREDVEWLGERVPGQPSFRLTRGLLRWAEGDRDAACGDFETALAGAPNLRGAQFYGGVCHYRAGEYNQAQASLRNAYQGQAAPQVGRVLAATYLEQERFELAREVLRPILRNDPKDRAALALMARSEEGMGNSGKAVEYLQRLARQAPQDSRVRLQLGAGLLATGNLEAGRSVLSEALTLDPGLGEAGALLVMSFVERGEHRQALEAARRLAQQQPDAPLPRVLEGQVHLATGDREAARAAFRAALERDESDPGARHALARMAMEADNPEDARTHYRAVLDGRGDHVPTLTALAALEGQLGRVERAESLLERASGAAPSALSPRLLLARLRLSHGRAAGAITALESDDGQVPADAEALTLASRARFAAGRHEQALPDIRRLLELRPESTVPYVLLAQAQEATGRQEEALAQMHQVLDLDPDHPLALLVQARVHLRNGETEAAGDLLARVPEAHRDQPAYLDARGRLALREGRRDEALGYYRRAHEEAPSSRTVTRLAAFEQARGNVDRARELLAEWVSEHPEDIEAQLALGDLHASTASPERAAEAYRAVLDRNPGSARALNNLAWVLRERSPEEALRYAEQAVLARPDDPRFLDTLGMVLLAKGETERAIGELREAVTMAPEVPILRYHLARALARGGRREAARSELEVALSGDGAFPARKEARALLEELETDG